MKDNKTILAIVLLLLLATRSIGQSHVVHSVFLVGDCGEPDIVNQPLGARLKAQIDSSKGMRTVLFLGDNIYPKGMPGKGDEGRIRAEKILEAQASWAVNAEQAIFIPGNHDWSREKKSGMDFILNQQEWIHSLNKKNLTLAPANACAGPVEIELTNNVVLLIIDTQWPLHRYKKGGADSGCKVNDADDMWKALEDAYKRNAAKRVILAGHHPMISYGEHGGEFTILDHLFPLTIINPNLYVPLPVIGSIYPLYRQWFGHRQDLKHPKYKAMSKTIRGIMSRYPGSIDVAGHEHALQYIVEGSSKFIVSGSGSKRSHVKRKGKSKFASSKQGFGRIDVLDNGDLTLSFWEVDQKNQGRKMIFQTPL